ncbi:hypothetical protein [Paenibacillus xylanilyticus]
MKFKYYLQKDVKQDQPFIGWSIFLSLPGGGLKRLEATKQQRNQ